MKGLQTVAIDSNYRAVAAFLLDLRSMVPTRMFLEKLHDRLRILIGIWAILVPSSFLISCLVFFSRCKLCLRVAFDLKKILHIKKTDNESKTLASTFSNSNFY